VANAKTEAGGAHFKAEIGKGKAEIGKAESRN
jgi:hypothetical protein